MSIFYRVSGASLQFVVVIRAETAPEYTLNNAPFFDHRQQCNQPYDDARVPDEILCNQHYSSSIEKIQTNGPTMHVILLNVGDGMTLEIGRFGANHFTQ